MTAVVTMSSVDTDSTSPASTAAGASEPAAYISRQPAGVPLAEGVEGAGAAAASSDPQQQQQGEQQGESKAASAGGWWDVEHGGIAAQVDPQAAQAPVPARSRSQRWVQSRGNIWLLQGLADVLGISRDTSGPDGAGADAVVGPVGSGGGAAGGKASGGLSSAAGGLWPDEGVCGCACGGKWGTSHVPKMAPLTASQRLTNEAIMQVWDWARLLSCVVL